MDNKITLEEGEQTRRSYADNKYQRGYYGVIPQELPFYFHANSLFHWYMQILMSSNSKKPVTKKWMMAITKSSYKTTSRNIKRAKELGLIKEHSVKKKRAAGIPAKQYILLVLLGTEAREENMAEEHSMLRHYKCMLEDEVYSSRAMMLAGARLMREDTEIDTDLPAEEMLLLEAQRQGVKVDTDELREIVEEFEKPLPQDVVVDDADLPQYVYTEVDDIDLSQIETPQHIVVSGIYRPQDIELLILRKIQNPEVDIKWYFPINTGIFRSGHNMGKSDRSGHNVGINDVNRVHFYIIKNKRVKNKGARGARWIFNSKENIAQSKTKFIARIEKLNLGNVLKCISEFSRFPGDGFWDDWQDAFQKFGSPVFEKKLRQIALAIEAGHIAKVEDQKPMSRHLPLLFVHAESFFKINVASLRKSFILSSGIDPLPYGDEGLKEDMIAIEKRNISLKLSKLQSMTVSQIVEVEPSYQDVSLRVWWLFLLGRPAEAEALAEQNYGELLEEMAQSRTLRSMVSNALTGVVQSVDLKNVIENFQESLRRKIKKLKIEKWTSQPEPKLMG